jgi:O-acetyl-ADP-ribose deacetylase (regulator of RNase III)
MGNEGLNPRPESVGYSIDFKVILVNPDPMFAPVFQKAFDDLPNSDVVVDEFQNLPEFDCMATAANSFGLMDGGVDFAVSTFFGRGLMKRVQQHILEEYLGEQPVGTSFIVETGHPKHPYVAHTPTMRVPMAIQMTDYVYLAMWTTLLAVRKHNLRSQGSIRTLACAIFGTECGQVPYYEAARQMAAAYQNFLYPPKRITWDHAGKRQEQVRYGGNYGFLLSRIQQRRTSNDTEGK